MEELSVKQFLIGDEEKQKHSMLLADLAQYCYKSVTGRVCNQFYYDISKVTLLKLIARLELNEKYELNLTAEDSEFDEIFRQLKIIIGQKDPTIPQGFIDDDYLMYFTFNEPEWREFDKSLNTPLVVLPIGYREPHGNKFSSSVEFDSFVKCICTNKHENIFLFGQDASISVMQIETCFHPSYFDSNINDFNTIGFEEATVFYCRCPTILDFVNINVLFKDDVIQNGTTITTMKQFYKLFDSKLVKFFEKYPLMGEVQLNNTVERKKVQAVMSGVIGIGDGVECKKAKFPSSIFTDFVQQVQWRMLTRKLN